MDIDRQFLMTARAAFDPFLARSGTEHVAQLLYSIVRMVKPKSVVEFGSGYTTLFLLAALKENALDFIEESDCLRAKTDSAIAARASTESWYEAGGKACGVDPGFYLDSY